METELARTFLTVVAAGSFVGAAERLHVTQSTVSTRIHALEEQLGCSLLVRNKAGTTLTPAGRRFQKHAAMLVRTVERARQEVGVPSGYRAALTVGGRFGLWEGLLLRWLQHFAEQAPDVSVRAEIGFEDDLMQGLVEGRIDLGVMYTPQSRPGLTVERLLEEQLVLVSTRAAPDPQLGEGYVYVDWGPEFYARHAVFFPEFGRPRLVASIGWLGLQVILQSGGSGYFPRRLVEPHLTNGRLHLASRAPDFRLPAYLVHPDEATPAVALAVASIREIARAASEEPAQTAATMKRRRKGNKMRPSDRRG
ncbi:MAG TPA: LysR family transcriptional regulator [Geminicoccaceae bacterium]|nr:LysR family transcriptional regulator [Geminicoccaceae bacterium]